MLAITAPGQGAQAPGFLAPWLDVPGVAEQIAALSDIAGRDLARCGTTADADEIRDTATAQPLLVAAAIAAAGALFGDVDEAPRLAGAIAGHSVGELAAGALAGIVSPQDAMRLVRARGEAMAGAAAAAPATGMTALLGGEEAAVLSAIDFHGLTAANVNGAGQIVAAGTEEQLAALAAAPPPGARLRPLKVAGAFHTVHMAPAAGALRDAAGDIAVSDPRTTLLSNRDGAAVHSGQEWISRVVEQVREPVRWDACMRAFAELGVSAIIELPPAGTLTGLARRALPGTELLALKTPGDLGAARQLVATHAVAAAAPTPQWRLLVAPHPGVFRAAAAMVGDDAAATQEVTEGTEVGHVDSRGTKHPVRAPCAGHVVEWLVHDADPVSVGQPVARLEPQIPE